MIIVHLRMIEKVLIQTYNYVHKKDEFKKINIGLTVCLFYRITISLGLSIKHVRIFCRFF